MYLHKILPPGVVCPIMLDTPSFPGCNFMSGTGFFVQFSDNNHVFFITARHCVVGNDNLPYGFLNVPFKSDGKTKQPIILKNVLTTQDKDGTSYEDVLIFVIDDAHEEQMKELRERRLRLVHRDCAETILCETLGSPTKLTVLGFPGTDKKGIDYDTQEAFAETRSFRGELAKRKGEEFALEKIDWKDNRGDLSGFSGSPVVCLYSTPVGIQPIPVGVLITGSNNIARFLSINIATDTIASYLHDLQNSHKK